MTHRERCATVTINKGNIKDIIFADQVADQVKQNRAKLDKRDVKGAFNWRNLPHKTAALDVARDLLEEAQTLEPDNADVKAQLQSVNAQLHMNRAETAAGAVPGKPQTQPSAAAPATQASIQPPGGPPSRRREW